MGTRGGDDSPQRAVALAHADTAQDLVLVGWSLPQVFTHDVTTQAKAHDDQLRQGVRPPDVVYHGSKFPGAACGQRGGHATVRKGEREACYETERSCQMPPSRRGNRALAGRYYMSNRYATCL